MPFTPAHAAIVIPFLKINQRYVSATGLVIGSLAPDFEYFFKFSVDSNYSHTLLAILYFNIPVSMILALSFHNVVKRNLISNFPSFIQQKFLPLRPFHFSEYLRKHPFVFIISAAFGALSHIFWDAFTHNDAFFVRELSFYKDAFVPYRGARYPLWYALQHISTVVGLLVVSFYVLMRPNEKSMTTKPDFRYWVFVTLITTLAVVVRFSIKSADFNPGNIVVSIISGFCIAVFVCGLIRFNKAADNR
jgi:hypothetical protein